MWYWEAGEIVADMMLFSDDKQRERLTGRIRRLIIMRKWIEMDIKLRRNSSWGERGSRLDLTIFVRRHSA